VNPLIDATGPAVGYGAPEGFGVAANVDVGAGFRVPGAGGGAHNRVALMLVGAGALLAALKFAGFRFNVGVTSG
jgi:hypothetical protein